MATTQTLISTLPDIFYEDPELVEDHMLQEEPLTPILNLLHKRYADRPDVFVSGGFVMHDEKNGNARVAPDCYIAFGVDERASEKRWLTSRYGG